MPLGHRAHYSAVWLNWSKLLQLTESLLGEFWHSRISAKVYRCSCAFCFFAVFCDTWNTFPCFPSQFDVPVSSSPSCARKDMFYTVTWNLGTSSFAEVAIWRWATLELLRLVDTLDSQPHVLHGIYPKWDRPMNARSKIYLWWMTKQTQNRTKRSNTWQKPNTPMHS